MGYHPLHLTQHQFDIAADLLDLGEQQRIHLRVPQCETTIRFPITLSDGHVRMCSGYRVQHIAGCPALTEGLYFTSRLDLDVLRATAMQLTWMCAAVNIPFSGAQGGIPINPYHCSSEELLQISGGYTARMLDFLGCARDQRAMIPCEAAPPPTQVTRYTGGIGRYIFSTERNNTFYRRNAGVRAGGNMGNHPSAADGDSNAGQG